MRTSHAALNDVLIAGAGPVGLFLACELRLAGCSVLVLGQARDPHSPLKGLPFGLRGFSVPTIESFDRRDLLGAIKDHAVGRDAPPGLLDSYMRERHPVGTQILDWSRAQVALMRPSRSSRAIEAIIRALIETRDGATYFAERVWGVSLRYDLGGSHSRVGRSAPDFEMIDGTRLNEHLRDRRGLLLDLGSRASLQAHADGWGDRVRYVRGEAKDRLGLSALLVRPDGIVVWATDSSADDEGVDQVASRWFGRARNVLA